MYVDGCVINYVHPATTRSIVESVVSKLDRQRVSLTTRMTCLGENFSVQSLG